MKRIDKIRGLSVKDMTEWLSMQNRGDIPDIVFQCWHYCTRDVGCMGTCPFKDGKEFLKKWLEEECGDLSHMDKLQSIKIPWVKMNEKFVNFGGKNEK